MRSQQTYRRAGAGWSWRAAAGWAIVLLAAGGAGPPAFGGPNLIENPGFEGGALPGCSGIPQGWESPSGCVPAIQSLSTDRHSGQWAEKLGGHPTWDYGRIQQVTNYNSIQEGKTYRISVWIKTQGIDNPAGWGVFRIEPYNNDTALWHEWMPQQEVLNYDWREITWDVAVPTGLGINRFSVVLTRHWGNGEVWYDDVSVTEVTGGPPTIGRSPVSFTHEITKGDALPDDSFTIQNTGGSTLNYTITDDAGWLSVSPAGGSSDGEVNAIAVPYAVSGLGVGVYAATITITDPAATNSPQTIAVSLTVTVPGDFDLDGDVDQTDYGYFQACYTGPGVEQTDAACAPALLDGDPDVDVNDFALFQGCMSGAGVPADPGCAG